jgi:hypothetical protein
VESQSDAAIIPASINHSTGHLELIGETLFDYRDVLQAGDGEALALAWRKLAEYGRPLHVTAVGDLSARERWSEFPRKLFAQAPWVDRQLTDEQQFRSAHPRAARQFRRLGKMGARLTVSSGNQYQLEEMYRRKGEQETSAGVNLFRDPQRRRFMQAAAAIAGDNCTAFTLSTQDGSLISGLITFRDRDVRRFYTTYFDAGWASHSPGVALLYEATARSLGEGLSCDYMTGEYPYKLRFANASRPLYQIDVEADALARIAARTAIAGAA